MKSAIPIVVILTLFCAPNLFAETVEYDLTIERGTVNFTGKERPAMTINGGIPGPTLRFREGDEAVIRVHNAMDVDSSIHWHGILLPNNMDGVPNVTYPPIEPGETFTYRFPLRHSGTYWYHSHSRLQEQRGVYGSIVITPKGGPDHAVDRDEVVLLSDWADEDAHQVMRTLKRGSEWYGIRKNSAQSLAGAMQRGKLGDFFSRELQRMPAMDISDVYYDRFLANGQPDSTLSAAAGETVRLRIIDGSATSFFFVEFAGGPMTIVAADGLPVEPIKENRFLIGVAETYDVLVRVPNGGSYEFRATAHDGSGHASVWIGNGERHAAKEIPLPDLYSQMGKVRPQQLLALTPSGVMGMTDAKVNAGTFDKPGMAMDMDMGDAHAGMDMGGGDDSPPMKMKMDHGGAAMKMDMEMDMSPNEVMDGMDAARPWPIYDRLRALKRTAFANDKPVREIRLTLDGNMERYVWLLNNKALHESDQIHIKSGEVVRFIMINRTMMHHPMHLHGHFFRVVNAQGDFAPLKHTVDVTPMSTSVIEFESDELGDWFFHCHLLYHMHSGMARVVEYDDFEPSPEVRDVRENLYEDPWYFWGGAAGMSHMTEGGLVFSNTRNILASTWEIGWGEIDGTDYEINLTYDYSINQFSSVFGGAQLTNEELGDRGIFGFRHKLPMLIDAFAWADTEGEFRFGAGKSYPLTQRLHAFGEIEYDTATEWEWAAGLEYVLGKNMSLVGSYHSEFGAGAGFAIRF
ncbi:MAG: CopA family copper-resistance protein [Verrucomicrobiales bacterium]|jgi:CopA family copper-resistance protein